MAKSYYGPGSSGAVTPVAAQGWTGGYGGPQVSGAAGGTGWSVAPALGGMGYDPATNRQTNRSMDPNAGGMFAQAQGGAGGMGVDLAASRARILGTLGEGSSIFRGQLGQGTQQNLMARVSGQQQPYDQGTQDRMFAAAADQSNAAAAAQEQRARDFFANSGTGGSGAQLQGLLDVATTHDQNMQAARSDITNRAQLENFGARERAANDARDFMGAQSAGEAPYRLKEADYLSGDEVTTQGQDPQIAALMRLLSGGQQSPRVSGGGFRMGETGANQRTSQSSTRRLTPSPATRYAPASGMTDLGGFVAFGAPDLGPLGGSGYLGPATAGGAPQPGHYVGPQSMDYFAQAALPPRPTYAPTSSAGHRPAPFALPGTPLQDEFDRQTAQMRLAAAGWTGY
jgi:hypothetical protein